MASIPTTTAPTWSATARRAPEALRAGGFALAVAAVELLLAHGVVGPQVARYIFLFLGIFVVALVFRFPLATALVFLGFTDFIFSPTYFAHNVGSLSVRPHEVAFACLLLLAVVRPRRRTWGGATGAALAVFLALVALSAVIAVKGGSTALTEAFNWARPLGLLMFFYVVIRLFPSPRERRLLLTGCAVLAAATGVVAVAISVGAGPFSGIAASAREAVTGQAGAESIERVRLAGLSAGYALFWFSAVQIALRRGGTRILWTLLLAGIAVDIALSYNRNMWLGLVIGAVLMAVLGGPLVRSRIAIGIVVVIAGLSLVAAVGSSGGGEDILQPVIKRGSTLLRLGKTEQESSLQARAEETDEALAVAKEHPLLGVGAGVPFGVTHEQVVLSGPLLVGVEIVPQLFLHNQYLYLVLIAGLPGLIAFLIFLAVPIAHALRRSPRDPLITACGVGLILIMVSSVVAIYFTVEDMTAVIGLLTGVLIADAEGFVPGRPSGLLP